MSSAIMLRASTCVEGLLRRYVCADAMHSSITIAGCPLCDGAERKRERVCEHSLGNRNSYEQLSLKQYRERDAVEAHNLLARDLGAELFQGLDLAHEVRRRLLLGAPFHCHPGEKKTMQPPKSNQRHHTLTLRYLLGPATRYLLANAQEHAGPHLALDASAQQRI
jgi:hypothetical protein